MSFPATTRGRKALPGGRPRGAFPFRPVPLSWALPALLLLTPGLAAQDALLEEMRRALDEARRTIASLEARVAALEAQGEQDPLEAQLQALLGDEPDEPVQRTVFPSAGNPRIGVFMDAVVEAGQTEEKLGENGDRFSLRETEVDFRLPISPFAEGALISVFEDQGNGEYEATIEEGYTDVALGALLDNDWTTRARIGRFRVPFGHDNRLHTHDLPQVDRPYVISQQLGEEGLLGDGISLNMPIAHRETESGLGRTTTLDVAVVNGEMFTGSDSLLGELADDSGLTLDSDAPVAVARASRFMELDERSDLEFGASWLDGLASDAVTTDVDTDIRPRMLGADVTWRQRDDETGIGSWLVQGEAVQTDFDYQDTGVAGFPVGNDRTRGAAFTVQRQLSPNTYVGMRYGETDTLGSGDEVRDLSPYLSFYADEFFRLRVEAQRLELDEQGGNDTTAHRVFLQATWNFGAHSPHPYWTNR